MRAASYLEVEHAGLGSVFELGLAGALLEEGVDLDDQKYD